MMGQLPGAIEQVGEIADRAATPKTSHSRQRELELRQLMTENLGGTLELSALQQRLLNSMTRSVALDGLHYHHESLDLDIRVGKQSSHSCGYRLLCTNEDLGEIVFKRSRRFSERELQLIEAIIPALVSPLRISLRSRQSSETPELTS